MYRRVLVERGNNVLRQVIAGSGGARHGAAAVGRTNRLLPFCSSLLSPTIATSAKSTTTTTAAVEAISVNNTLTNNTQRRWFSKEETTETTTTTSPSEPTPGVGKYKTSTGLTGLAVEPDWYNIILKKFQILLDRLEESDMPETAQYRVDVTKWCNAVIKVTKENGPDNPEAVEDYIRMGQVEELIEMADDEMIAMDTYLETRMWELVDDPNIDFNPNPLRDPMAEDGDPAEQEKFRKGME